MNISANSLEDALRYTAEKASLSRTGDHYFRSHYGRIRATVELVQVQAGAKVLDVGIIPGYIALSLACQGAIVCGISNEIESERAEMLIQKGIELKQCNIEVDNIPYEDNSFDWVIFSEVIEHVVASPRKALGEIRRVLKPSGRLILTTPNVVRLRNRAQLLLGQNIYGDLMSFYARDIYKRHNREFTLQEILQLLRSENFAVLSSFFINNRNLAKGSWWFQLRRKTLNLLEYLCPSLKDIIVVVVGSNKV